jgi:hypothetical protein
MERLKIQPARVTGGVIEIAQGADENGEPIFLPADDGILFSAGQADSIGFVIIGSNSCRYITNTQIDAAYMLETLAALCDQIAAIGDHQTYVIGGVTPIFGPIIELVQIATDTKALKTEIEGKTLV